MRKVIKNYKFVALAIYVHNSLKFNLLIKNNNQHHTFILFCRVFVINNILYLLN